MQKSEVDNAIVDIIEGAIKRGYVNQPDLDLIWAAIGKLAPEPKPKPEVPWYDPKKVKRVGTLVQRVPPTQEQRQAAIEALRAVGLL